MRSFIIILVLVVGTDNLFGQTYGSGKVVARVQRVIGYIGDGNQNPEYRHIVGVNTSNPDIEFRTGGEDQWASVNRIIHNESYTNNPNSFSISFRAFEYDKGKGSSNDDAKIGSLTFDLSPRDYPAGNVNKLYLLIYQINCEDKKQLFTTINAYNARVTELLAVPSCLGLGRDWIWGLELGLSYTAPTPRLTYLTEDSSNPNAQNSICLGDELKFRAEVPSSWDAEFEYEYAYDGDEVYEGRECDINPNYCGPCDDYGNFRPPCCSVPRFINCRDVYRLRWRSVPASATRRISQNTTTDEIAIDFAQLTTIERFLKPDDKLRVFFRTRSVVEQSTSENSRLATPELSPAPPKFDIISVTPSCSGIPTGTIQIETALNHDYGYIIQESECLDPSDNSCLTGAVSHGTFDGRSFKIEGIPNGNFYVYIKNNGGRYGNCATVAEKRVEVIPEPDIEIISSTDVSCPEGTDGGVQLYGTSGLTPYMFSLRESQNIIQVETTPTGQFTNLSANTYQIELKDQCNETDYIEVSISQPARLIGEFGITPPTCTNEPDGALNVSVAYDDNYGKNVVAGGDRINYKLLDENGQVETAINNSSEFKMTLDDLPSGAYTLQANDATRNCDPLEFSIQVPEVPALGLNLEAAVDASCFGAADGEIRLKPEGGSGSYSISLRGLNSRVELENGEGEFINLTPDTYQAVLQNSNSCSDEYLFPELITISEPEELKIDLQGIEISCFGNDDGEIKASLSGFSGYNYSWFVNNSLLKQGDHNSDINLDQVYPGIYYLEVRNENGCSLTSASVTIDEPPLLEIPALDIFRPTCFEDVEGRIIPLAIGGIGNYTFQFSDNNGQQWQTYSADNIFPSGQYLIRVTDENGCLAQYGEPVEFIKPDAPLTLAMSAQSNEGFIVSCYGSSDGEVHLSGNGGIAFEDHTYLYAVDNGAFTTNSIIQGLSEGEHSFQIKDANGCVRNENLYITQPPELVLQLVEKEDVLCYGQYTGRVIVEASGGVGGYVYSIDEGEFTANSRFENLQAGEHKLEVRDKNQCSTHLLVPIEELTEPMTIRSEVTDISCFGLNDGSISLNVIGGTEPYVFKWSNDMEGSLLTGLSPGVYSLALTDANGCQVLWSTTLAEPEALDIGGSAVICRGQEYTIDGTVSLPNVTYTWKNSAGETIANQAEITVDSPDRYILQVITADGCVYEDYFDLLYSDVDFNVNFLMATQVVENDTLVLAEVSSPRPDSVSWTFVGDVIVVSADEKYPNLRYDEIGHYDIELKAYFNGCVDHQVKTVEIIKANEVPEGGRVQFGEVGVKTAHVYPNPSDGKFRIAIEQHQIADLEVSIYNANGYRVANQSESGSDFYLMSFDISDQPSGVYVLEIVAADKVETIRLVIN